VHDFIGANGVVAREQILNRFKKDDELALRSVLHDLTESGVVFQSGSGRSSAYRMATLDELGQMRRSADLAGVEAFVWSIIYREQPIDKQRLSALCGLSETEVDTSIASLIAADRVQAATEPNLTLYRTRELVLKYEDPAGWEASVLDHFTALVRTVTTKLALDQKARLADQIGGSTYHFTLWRGHPYESRVLGELKEFRQRMSALRDEIDGYNAATLATTPTYRVDAYYGQTNTHEELQEMGEDRDL
jgi:hypothetical protein